MNLEDALSKLLDDSDFLTIEESRRRFNIFDAMGGQRAELRHSNFLKFLLSPDENHGHASRFLRMFLRGALNNTHHDRRPVSTLQVAVADLDDAVIYREVDYIDVLIVINELKLVVVIENKVGAKAGKGQLAGYKDAVDQKYPQHKKLLVFLTPRGTEPDQADYVAMNYSELARMVDDLRAAGSTSASANGIDVVLDHYTQMLRRHVVEDEKLKELAARIYEKHAPAFEFVFKNRPQGTNFLSLVRSLALSNPAIIEDKHNETRFRFSLSDWQSVPALNSCPVAEWSKSGRNVLFTVRFDKKEGMYNDRVLVSLILGPSEPNLRQRLFDAVHARRELFGKGLSSTVNSGHATLFARELLSTAQASEMEDEEKREVITNNWNDFVANEMPSMAAALTEIGRNMVAAATK